MANEVNRGSRKVRTGTVTSKMGAKSVVVKAEYRELHPVYGKVGDKVVIMETRPLSATKRWRVVTPEAK